MTISFITFDTNLNHLVRSPSKIIFSGCRKSGCVIIGTTGTSTTFVLVLCVSFSCVLPKLAQKYLHYVVAEWMACGVCTTIYARKKMLNYRCKVRFESNKFPGASLNGFTEQSENEKNKFSTKAVAIAHSRGRHAVRRAWWSHTNGPFSLRENCWRKTIKQRGYADHNYL